MDEQRVNVSPCCNACTITLLGQQQTGPRNRPVSTPALLDTFAAVSRRLGFALASVRRSGLSSTTSTTAVLTTPTTTQAVVSGPQAPVTGGASSSTFSSMVTNPDLLDFVLDPVAISRLDANEAALTFTLFDPVRQTRLVLKEAHWSVGECLAEARRHVLHLGPQPRLHVLGDLVPGLPTPQIAATPLYRPQRVKTLPLNARPLQLGICVVAAPVSPLRFSLAYMASTDCKMSGLHQRVARGTALSVVSGVRVSPFQSLDFYVDFLGFRPHTGVARPPVTPRPISARIREVLDDIADDLEDASIRDDFSVMLHWPGSPPTGINIERSWNEDSLLFAISDALAPTIPHFDIAVHFPCAIPRGTDGLLHLLLDIDRSLDSRHTLFLLDGRLLRPSGPPLRAVLAGCDLHMSELFCLVRDAFPSALPPAHLRVNGRLLTSMQLLHYYCPLVRALPALSPEETADMEVLDSSAHPVEEVVSGFPGLLVDLQRARAALTTSTTTCGVGVGAVLASTTSTTSPDSAHAWPTALPSASSFKGGDPAAPSTGRQAHTCVLSSLDDLPLRFFLSAPNGHVEALTLSGSLPAEDVLAQLCWQLAGASALFNDVVLLACDRAFVDVDQGLSISVASHVASAPEHAWLDYDPAFRFPSVVRLPFTLTVSALKVLCLSTLPPGSHIAISGTPGDRKPYQLRHSDVILVRACSFLLFSIPLSAVETRVAGMSMLLVHQLGPGPRPPLQLQAGDWCTLPQAPPHDLESLRAFWLCTHLGWPIHLEAEVPFQRCLLVGLDIPPLVVTSGTCWAPQDFDINLFYRTHLSSYVGERR